MATILKRLITMPNSGERIGAVRLKWTGRCRQLVEGTLGHQWSPEQIAHWLGRSEGISISHERIYQHIRSGQAEGGTLHTQLRHRLGPKRATTKRAYKGSIANRISIDERLAIVEEKQRGGDGEVDLMMGGQGGGALWTLVERKSHFMRIAPVDSKHADHVAEVLIDTWRSR